MWKCNPKIAFLLKIFCIWLLLFHCIYLTSKARWYFYGTRASKPASQRVVAKFRVFTDSPLQLVATDTRCLSQRYEPRKFVRLLNWARKHWQLIPYLSYVHRLQICLLISSELVLRITCVWHIDGFFKMGIPRPLLSFIFDLLKQTLQFLQQ